MIKDTDKENKNMIYISPQPLPKKKVMKMKNPKK